MTRTGPGHRPHLPHMIYSLSMQHDAAQGCGHVGKLRP